MGLKEKNTNSPDDNDDFRYLVSNEKLLNVTKATNISSFFAKQQASWIGHIVREENDSITKMLLFNTVKNKKKGRPVNSILSNVLKRNGEIDKLQFYSNCLLRKF